MGKTSSLRTEMGLESTPELVVVESKPRKKAAKKELSLTFEDLTPEQQDILNGIVKNASDAACKKIVAAFGMQPPTETRDTLLAAYVTGQFSQNRNDGVPTALMTKIRKALDKTEVKVKHNGREYVVRFKNGVK